jgi:hypothetical protein
MDDFTHWGLLYIATQRQNSHYYGHIFPRSLSLHVMLSVSYSRLFNIDPF